MLLRPVLMACALAVVSAPAAHAYGDQLTGTVAYAEKAALPPTAALSIKLVDRSIPNQPRVIADYDATPAGQQPIGYRLPFDTDNILGGHRYFLQAEITYGGTVLYGNGRGDPVDPLSARYPIRLELAVVNPMPPPARAAPAPKKSSGFSFDN